MALKKKHKAKLIWLGLDRAGKTSLVRRVMTGEFAGNTHRTMGLNVDKLVVESDQLLEFVSWDLGGQVHFRTIWESYLAGSDAIIFVIDSADESRFPEAKKELWKYVIENKNLSDRIPILILANKQDLPEAKSTSDLISALGLNQTELHSYMILGVSALSGQGLVDAMNWLAERVAALIN